MSLLKKLEIEIDLELDKVVDTMEEDKEDLMEVNLVMIEVMEEEDIMVEEAGIMAEEAKAGIIKRTNNNEIMASEQFVLKNRMKFYLNSCLI